MSSPGLYRLVFVSTFVLTGAAGVTSPASGQEADPLVKSEVIRLLVDDTYSPDERQEIVRRNCLTFSPSEGDFADFRRLGASERLLAVLRECASRGQVSTGGEAPARETELPPPPTEIVVSPPDLSGEPAWRHEWDALDLDRDLAEVTVPPPSEPSRTRESLFAPVEIPPRLENPAEVQRMLRAAVPTGTLPEGRRARCVVWVFVDETGTVRGATMEASSGSDAFDQAALAIADSMRFRPATSGGHDVATWVQQTLSIQR